MFEILEHLPKLFSGLYVTTIHQTSPCILVLWYISVVCFLLCFVFVVDVDAAIKHKTILMNAQSTLKFKMLPPNFGFLFKQLTFKYYY